MDVAAPAAAPAIESVAEAEAPVSAPSAEAKPKYKVKVDKEELEVEVDELIKRYEHVSASNKRMKEAADLRKQAQAELEALKKDPWSKIKELGHDPYDLAEKLLLEKMEYDGLSEGEKRALQAEMKLAQLEKAQQDQDKARSEFLRQQAEHQALKEIDSEISQALAEYGHKPTPRLIARIAETLLAHHETSRSKLKEQFGEEIPEEAWTKAERLSAKDALKRVDEEYMSDILEYLEGMPVEKLPKSLREKLREHELKQVLSQDPAGSRKPRQEMQASKKEKAVRTSTDTFFARMDQKFK